MFGSEDRLLKLPLSCEVVQKGDFWAPGLYGVGYPRFRTCITLTCDHLAWLSSVRRAQRLAEEKKRKKESRLENVAGIAMYCHLRIGQQRLCSAAIE